MNNLNFNLENKRGINENIREIRRKKDIPLKEAAWVLDISVQAYQKLENGKIKVQLEHINKLATLFEMNPLEIVTYPYQVSVLETLRDVAENSPWIHHLPPKEDNPINTSIKYLEGIIEEQRRIIADQRYLLERCLEGKAGEGG